MTDVQLVQLAEFGRWCLLKHRADGGGDLDAGELQDKAEDIGLLVRVSVEKPCGEHCTCAEFVDEWPARCLRLAEWL
jgi:hypothetical protein